MTAYNRLFWGFLFMFDFRINGFDLLPDVIGCWLFYQALKELAEQSRHFLQAKEYVLPLLLFSVFDIYQIQGSSEPGPLLLIGLLFGLALLILDLLVVYHLCRGIIEKAAEAGEEELEYTAEKRWKMYFFLKVVFFILFPLMLLLQQAALIIFVPYFIFWIIVLVLMMRLMKQAEEVLC